LNASKAGNKFKLAPKVKVFLNQSVKRALFAPPKTTRIRLEALEAIGGFLASFSATARWWLNNMTIIKVQMKARI
jgi:hypothetical protein